MPILQESVQVRYRTVSITVFPWVNRRGDTYWRFRNGKKHVTRSTLDAAKYEAKRIAEETFLGGAKLGSLNDAQIRAIRRMLEVDPQLSRVDDFLAWHRRAVPKKETLEAVAEFLEAKRANAGLSNRNVETLTRHVKRLPSGNLGDFTPATLPTLTGCARTRRNTINGWVTFFRWAQRQGYLQEGAKTAPELLEKPQVERKIPSTWTRKELDKLIAGVSKEYLPWLVLGAWAGTRTEEVCKSRNSRKSALRWEDFHWEREILIVRPEVSKTGHRRVVPIQPVLRAALWPLRKPSGLVCPGVPPHTPPKGGVPAHTTTLGKLVGGWKRNALRHSFISYRAATKGVGLAQTATEAGNSESEARRSYNDAKSEQEANEWFAVQSVTK